MKLEKEIEVLKKKLQKKQNKINKLIISSRIEWRKRFFKLSLLSVIVISILLIIE